MGLSQFDVPQPKSDLTMSRRRCCLCSRILPRDSYSTDQWAKGVGLSQCGACVHGIQGTPQIANLSVVVASQTARTNNAHQAQFEDHDLNHPFAQGAFRWVAKGKYTDGNRVGEPCVCKWFKTGGVMESHFYRTDLASSEEAICIVTKWNSQKLIDRMVRVNKPEVWTFDYDAHSPWSKKKVLQEPFITDYQKFNSNSGWSDDSIPWSRVMQALSHFSYHFSNGRALLCDLQGGIYQDGVVLTDPVVMSPIAGQYGPTDLGPDGISTFFYHHQCNEFCSSGWRTPSHRAQYYLRTVNTTMDHVPTRHTRQPMSAMHPY